MPSGGGGGTKILSLYSLLRLLRYAESRPWKGREDRRMAEEVFHPRWHGLMRGAALNNPPFEFPPLEKGGRSMDGCNNRSSP